MRPGTRRASCLFEPALICETFLRGVVARAHRIKAVNLRGQASKQAIKIPTCGRVHHRYL
ncbi:hypothetical protein GCM10022226_83190 [Sphaerisporangium flaviroseum]|uniref:Uncharacterized protein n=1 Tax=Sphaerisporangium flaviroseum TaxID=509199 RepID=A0ABP7JK57_9ACTN